MLPKSPQRTKNLVKNASEYTQKVPSNRWKLYGRTEKGRG